MSPGHQPRWSKAELDEGVRRLAAEIGKDHPDGVVVVGLLKGSLCVVADLIRHLEVACVVDFLALSPYVAGAAKVRILKDLDLDVSGADVVLVRDVVDTGLSSRYVMRLLASRGASRVSLCALLDRPARRIVPVEVDYAGFAAPDDFLVGYGLDFAQRYRNLPAIYAVRPEELETDRSRFEVAVYAGTLA